jgi:hypothetical protein
LNGAFSAYFNQLGKVGGRKGGAGRAKKMTTA